MEEAHKAYRQGFQLDAASLTGLAARIDQHFANIGPDNGQISVKIKLKDQTILTLPDLDAVLSQGNVGRKEIIALEIKKEIGLDGDISSLIISFFEPVDGQKGDRSVIYSVSGPDRDWVRSLQIDLEEFISGVARPDYANIFAQARPFLVGVAILGMMGGMMYLATVVDSITVTSEDLNNLKSALKSSGNTFNDSLYEYAKWDSERVNRSLPMWVLIPGFIGLLVSSVSTSWINRVFKSQIFYFGGMMSVISQRRTMHSVFWVGIVFAVLVGVGANYLSRYLM